MAEGEDSKASSTINEFGQLFTSDYFHKMLIIYTLYN